MKDGITSTDELAGKVIEKWQEVYPNVELSGSAYHALREFILEGISDAVERDRQERLDYEETDRKAKQKAHGFTNMWNFN